MVAQGALIALQAFHVLFLWLHDWVPLGRLNDVAAARAADGTRRLVITTLIQALPYSLGLLFSLEHLGGPFPGWLTIWLWVSYGLLFAGELQAWWIPYAFGGQPARAERYREMFGATHAFLPARHGITPNTLHCLLHAATLVLLIALAAASA